MTRSPSPSRPSNEGWRRHRARAAKRAAKTRFPRSSPPQLASNKTVKSISPTTRSRDTAKSPPVFADWKPALGELSASYSAAYRLGFKPDGARKGHNDINVKVKNLPPGARLSFRKGFSTTVPAKGTAPDSFVLADIIQNDTPQSGTPPEVLLADGRVEVIVPVVQLSKQFGAVDGAKVMLYVFDAKGIPIVSKEKTFAIPKHADRDHVIQQKLDLPPGSYVVKVLLRVGDSLAFVKEPFVIPQ